MASEPASSEATETYDAFVTKVKRLSNIGNAAGVLRWDQEVMMPEGGVTARAEQLSTLSALVHEELTDEEMGEFLEGVAGETLSEGQRAVVREVRRRYDRNTRVETELVEEISRTTSEAHPLWSEARAEDDFEAFAPALEELVDLKREYARQIDPDADPYAVLFADYEPYLDLETAEAILGELRDELVPLIDAIGESDADLATEALRGGEFDADTQEALARDALDLLGYDWDRGRLDTAPHPFSTGTQFDARVTTRYDEADPIGAVMSTIHEFGHATYTLGLPDDHYGTPLGSARDLTVHESQSRFWENHVGRTRAFWELFLPTVGERFPQLSGVGIEEAYEAVNQVYDDNLIRVEADELTYHLHIVIRFEVERALIAGDIEVDEVPELWNDKYEEYLGIRPETDSEGCLQDIHWSHGSFGYFPTYSLGSVLAAQLDATIREEYDVDSLVEDGEFGPIHDWLTENVHRHGCRYTTPDLVEVATGDPYSAEPFVEYVTEKYDALYDL